MKKISVVLLCLAFFSLACLSTSAAISESPVTATVITLSAEEPAAGAVYEVPESDQIGQTLTKVDGVATVPRTCAIVIADLALHLRNGPSEKDIVLTWLKHGDQVQVLDRSDSDWWFVEVESFVGYARSVYLQESEC